MLPINSAKKVVPGGPVSSVASAKEILGGAKTMSFSTAKSARITSTIAGARLLAGVATTARKILQHGWLPEFLDLPGFEWNGQAVASASCRCSDTGWKPVPQCEIALKAQ